MESGGRAIGRVTDTATTTARIALLLFVGFSALYVAIARGVFLYGDDILMYQVTRGLVEDGSPAVSSPPTPGSLAMSIPGRQGRNYAKYGIGQSLVAAPAYVASDLVLDRLLPLPIITDADGNQRTGARIYGTALTNAALGGATVATLFLLALVAGYRRAAALILAGLLGLGTLLPHYAAGFLSEPLSALTLTATVGGIARWKPHAPRVAGVAHSGGMWWLTVSGFCAGLAIATRVATILTLIAPGMWLLWLAWPALRTTARRTLGPLLAWGAPVAGWLALIAFYNWWRFGSVTNTGYGGEARAYTTPLLTGLEGLLLSPGKGVLWYNPPLLLALISAWWFARRRPDLALTIGGMAIATLGLYARYYQWYGGGVWGPRFLVPLLPLLVLPAGELVERAWRSRVALIVTAAVATLGVFVTALAILVPFDRYVMIYSAAPAALHDALWKLSDAPLIVQLRWLDDTFWEPDIAAARYGSPRLVAIALVAGLVSITALAAALRMTIALDRRDAAVD